MKKWCVVLDEEKEAANKAGALFALGYLIILRLKAAGRREIKTTVRELAEDFGLADLRAVNRILRALRSANLIDFESTNRGTVVKFLSVQSEQNSCTEMTKNSVAEKSSPALSNPQHSVEQSSTPAPFLSFPLKPLNTLNPGSETYNYNDKKTSVYMQTQADLSGFQKFTDKVADNFESFENHRQKEIWFKIYKRPLNSIWEFCGQNTQTALRVIKACALMLKEKGFRGGYWAVERNLPMYYEMAKNMRD